MLSKFLSLLTALLMSALAVAADPVCNNSQLQNSALTSGKISVKDAGAIGDGITDDTTKIQEAIDCAFAGGSGYTVFFPPGGYKISKALIIHRNVDLLGGGIGWGSVIKPTTTLSDNTALRIDGTTQTGGFAFKNTISGLNVDMSATAGDKRAIQINNAYNIRIVDSYIRSSSTETTPAVASLDISNSNHITLDHIVLFGENTGAGIGLNVVDSRITVINADIEGHLQNVVVSESALGAGKLAMYGGYMERFGQYGIKFNNSSYNRLDGLTIKIPNNSPIGVSFSNSVNNRLSGVSILCSTNPSCQAITGSNNNMANPSDNLIQGTVTP